MQTTVEQLLNKLKCRLDVINKETTELREQMLQDLLVDTEKYLEMEKQQKMDFANWCRIHDNKYPLHIWTIQQLFDKYIVETYGSNGSDETNGNNVEEVPNVSNATEINWGGVVQHIPNICNCHQSNCHLINGKYICASCNKTLNVETQSITSSQTEISDEEINKKAMDILKDRWSHLYLDGYPKKPFPINYQHDLDIVMLGIYKSQQLSDKKPMRFHCVPKEISDEDILKEGSKRSWNFASFLRDYETAWVEGIKWYREQLKNKQ